MAKRGATRWFIDLLLDEEVKKLYMHFSDVRVVKFKDRDDAEQRLLNICAGKLPVTMVQAFKAVGVSQDVINQYGTMLRGPIAFPQGTMQPADFKKHEEALRAGKEKKSPTIKDSTAAVLLALRDIISPDATGEDLSVSSAVVAEKLGTNANAVCRAADQLAKQKLIEVEDDSPDDDHKFYWLTLLPEGRIMVVQPPKVKMPASNPGPSPQFAGKKLFRLVKENPRREGTHGYKSFALIKDGMTFEEYKKAGGRNNDLAWDIEKKFVALRGDGDEQPEVAAPEQAPVKTKGTINKKGKPMLPPGKRRKKTAAENKAAKEDKKVAKDIKKGEKALAKAMKAGK